MNAPLNLTTSKEFQGLLALAECDTSGAIVQSEGENAETLASACQYISQMAALIGNALGLDDLQEGRMIGKNVVGVAIPIESGVLGLMFDSKARIDALVHQLLESPN